MFKITACSYLLILLLTASFSACKAVKKSVKEQYQISITNPSAIERADDLVVLTREMIEAKTGRLNGNLYPSITGADNKRLMVQYDDLNKDGRWDEAVFLYKYEPNQKIVLQLSATAGGEDKTIARAHVRMRMKNDDNTFGPHLDSVTIPAGTQPTDFAKQKLPLYLTEGPAWENDKVAFRLYLDTRNTTDIYGKTTPRMMMDTVGANTKENYHSLSAWGMDILAVGKSLGAGSLALSLPTKNGKDTLVRLGGNNVHQTTFKKIADGPVRAIFEMHYTGWQALADGGPIDVKEEISIWGGQYFYQSKVTIGNAPQGTRLVTGVVNLKSKKSNELQIGKCHVLYTYDNQSENKDKLGLAIMVSSDQFAGFDKAPDSNGDVTNSYLVLMNLLTQPVVYRCYAGWEMSSLLFSRKESFEQFLTNEAVQFNTSVVIQ